MKNRRDGIAIMRKLIVLVKPLLPVMVLAVLFGVLGFLCAIFLMIVSAYGVLFGLKLGEITVSASVIFVFLFVLAIARGVLHYAEQYCNHFIAFKLLAHIRHKVFAALRKLCPAKLEGKDKGNLVTMITSDIELLEVFYAHTISPILIAVFVSLIMTVFIAVQYLPAAFIALSAYISIGIIIPLHNSRRSADDGMNFRESIGKLNTFVLDSLYGLDETIQYGYGERRCIQLNEHSLQMKHLQHKLSDHEKTQRSSMNVMIQVFSWLMIVLMMVSVKYHFVSFTHAVISIIALMSSFGPVIALSSLSNNLNQTLACGERVLSLLEEKPEVDEITDGEDLNRFGDVDISDLSFAYRQEIILKDVFLNIPVGKTIGIHGVSGSGKSTLLKLLMRFWKRSSGRIDIGQSDIDSINTGSLRQMESYVTQETWLCRDTIANNIAIAKPEAGRDEIIAAAKKASIHEFIESLPQGYDTQVGELGDTLSGGERQRIGIARAFLHNAPFILLDEPTSNLDSLNEGAILKALHEEKKQSTIVLVSHRKSTMSIADKVYEMDNGRAS